MSTKLKRRIWLIDLKFAVQRARAGQWRLAYASLVCLWHNRNVRTL
jgi:hypothetical protein